MVLKFGELPQFILPLVISEFLALAAVVCFTVSVWKVLMKSEEGAAFAAAAITPSAAE
jgi:hypothetical protein